jgi:pimeloyl-ACP methyl ester carboxylesterase
MQLDRALRAWADQLEAGVSRLPEQRAAWHLESARLTRWTADQLAARLVAATDQARTVAYEDTLAIWRDALARIVGDPAEADRLLGTVRVPSLSLLGQFSALGAAGTWKTLIRDDVGAAAGEANALILQGLTSGLGPEELARRLRNARIATIRGAAHAAHHTHAGEFVELVTSFLDGPA